MLTTSPMQRTRRTRLRGFAWSAVVVPFVFVGAGLGTASAAAPLAPSGPDDAAKASGCTLGPKLVPTCGHLWGAAPLAFSDRDRTVTTTEFESAQQRPLDLYHGYHQNGDKFPTSVEREISLDPSKPRLLLLNWRPALDTNWAAVSNGKIDARIDAAAENFKSYPQKFFLAIWAEAEHFVKQNPGSGMQASDYRDMVRYIINRLKSKGVTNAVYTQNPPGLPALRRPVLVAVDVPGRRRDRLAGCRLVQQWQVEWLQQRRLPRHDEPHPQQLEGLVHLGIHPAPVQAAHAGRMGRLGQQVRPDADGLVLRPGPHPARGLPQAQGPGLLQHDQPPGWGYGDYDELVQPVGLPAAERLDPASRPEQPQLNNGLARALAILRAPVPPGPSVCRLVSRSSAPSFGSSPASSPDVR